MKTKTQINCAADQRLCFRYVETRKYNSLLPKSKNSSLFLNHQQPGLCLTCVRNPKDRFFVTQLKLRLVVLVLFDTLERLQLSLYLSSPGSEVIKLFSFSTQLSMKFILLINIKIALLNGIPRVESHLSCS